LDARHEQLVTAGLNITDDEIEPQVWIIFIQPRLEICGLSVIVEIDYAPFDVEDAVRRYA